MSEKVREMSEEEIVEQIVELGFGGDHALYERFCRRLQETLPPGTEVVLRGSVVTNEQWGSGKTFDASGPGSSDLDVALVGEEVMALFEDEHFYIPRLNSEPLSDKSPEVAPPLNRLRLDLEEMVGRPVNFQATTELFLKARDIVLRQPFVKIVRDSEEA